MQLFSSVSFFDARMNDWLSFVNTRRLTDVTPPRIPVAHASLSTSLSASRSTGSLVRVGLSASTGSFRTVPVKGTLCDECLCRKCRCSTAPRRLPPLSQPLSQPATANHSLPQPTTAAAGGTEEVTLPTNTESGPVASERSAVASATAVVESELRSHRQKIISDMERFGGDNWWDNEMPTLPRSGKGVKSKLAKGRGGVFGAPFTDPESIWEALRAESGTATVLVRGSWLRKQEGLRRLPVRGSLPEEATIGVEELQAIWRASVRAERCTAIPVIAVSHAWKRADPGLTGQTYDRPTCSTTPDRPLRLFHSSLARGLCTSPLLVSLLAWAHRADRSQVRPRSRRHDMRRTHRGAQRALARVRGVGREGRGPHDRVELAAPGERPSYNRLMTV